MTLPLWPSYTAFDGCGWIEEDDTPEPPGPVRHAVGAKRCQSSS